MKTDDLLSRLLQYGEVKLEITIKLADPEAASHVRAASHPERLPSQEKFEVSCPYCKWQSTKSSAASASKALHSHQNHCAGYAREELDLSWITAMHGGMVIPKD